MNSSLQVLARTLPLHFKTDLPELKNVLNRLTEETKQKNEEIIVPHLLI